jgi:hypothetical protein
MQQNFFLRLEGELRGFSPAQQVPCDVAGRGHAGYYPPEGGAAATQSESPPPHLAPRWGEGGASADELPVDRPMVAPEDTTAEALPSEREMNF